MGSKKRRPQRGHPDAPRPKRPQHLQPQPTAKSKPKTNKTNAAQAQQHDKPIVPFSRSDRILLIGEGDLSFAASLVRHHKCRNVTATVLEKDPEELAAKYPENESAAVLASEAKIKSQDGEEHQDPEAEEDFDGDAYDSAAYDDDDYDNETPKPPNNRIIYSFDATKAFPSSVTRPPPTRIIFNFPHVGGLTKDVNRQVRHNQELLVSFFQRALPALAPGGSIIVTLFEGEPYTLWNVRDLARHAGLQVERSFRFRADAYPGYRHARTLGVVRNKKGEEGGGWKGEDRAARSYVFVRKGEVPQAVGKKKKRGGDESSDED